MPVTQWCGGASPGNTLTPARPVIENQCLSRGGLAPAKRWTLCDVHPEPRRRPPGMLFLASTFSSAALQLPARSSVASHSRAAVSMIAPVEVETKKAVEGPTLSRMVKRSLGSAPARLLCLLRARQTGSKAAWHSQEEAGASSPRQSLLQKAADFLVRLPMQVQQVTRDAGSDPGGGAEARARADEERCALPLHARRRIGDRAGTSGCFHKKATRRTAAYLLARPASVGAGRGCSLGKRGP